MKARVPKGMGGGPANMQGMIQQAQKMQEEMGRIQEELEAQEYTATVGGGVVKATVTGKKVLTDLSIEPEAVDPDDVEMLQDLILSAVNEAIRQAEADAEEKMGAVTGSMNMPFGL